MSGSGSTTCSVIGVSVESQRDRMETKGKLYGVKTGQLTRQVRRSLKRFTADFMIQLNFKEFSDLKCHFGTSGWGGTRKPPYAFTENGVAMLSSVLNSDRAIQVNIQIMRTFTRIRKLLASRKEILRKLTEHELKLHELNKNGNILAVHYSKSNKVVMRIRYSLYRPRLPPGGRFSRNLGACWT